MKTAELKLHVVGAGPEDDFRTELNPREFIKGRESLSARSFFLLFQVISWQ